MPHRSIVARLPLCAIVFICIFIPGQRGRAADTKPAPRIYRDRVEPNWFATNTRFWYRNDLPGDRREYIVVDAETGTRKPAFDATRAAEALSQAGVKNLDAARLPIESFSMDEDGNAVVLKVRGKAWRLDLKTYAATLSEIRPHSLESTTTQHRSRKDGPATRVTFENKTAETVDLFWVNYKDQREPMAELKPSGTWDAQTFDGHVWVALSKNKKVLNVFEAVREPSTAIIGSASVAPAIEKKGAPDLPKRQANRSAKSPDGKWLVVVNDGKLAVRNSETGTETILGSDGKPSDSYAADRVWWSPDSKKLLALRTEPAQEHKVYIVESSPKDQVQPKLKTLDYHKPGDKLAIPRPQLFDIAAMKSIPLDATLFSNPWSIEDMGWSGDSSRVSFVYNERGHQALRVLSIDAATGAVKAIIDERSKTFICYSGKYYCHWIGEREIVWMSERDGWNHLWLIDAQTGAVKNQITRGEWVVQSVTKFDEAKRCIWFNAGGIRPGQDPYYTHMCRVNLDGSGLTNLTEGDGQHVLKYSSNEAFYIDTYSRIDLAPVSELRRSDTGKLVCKLEEADASEVLAARGGRWPERFVAKARDGKTDIYGMILYPVDFDPAKKYPVIENIYAGPQGFFTPKNFKTNYGHQQKFADSGAIVIQCDGMGTSGRSKAFHDVCFKNIRDAGFPDRIAWIKAAAQTRPFMDLSRVGIYGGSAGGQNAMAALLWHHDFYKVAVADCGCHDNRMDKVWWNEQWMGWPVGKEYAENSNAVNAHLLEGKLMLVVGELDSNVDPASTMQVVGALEKANKDFDLLIVVGANHGAAETPYGSRRRLEYLMRNLK
ncbi:MAG: DPP IV N-terminal domain-containing protein [Planctomycetota bacterium]